MIKKLLLLIIILISISGYSQSSTYFRIGKNFTTYSFTKTNSEKAANIHPDLGNSYELGVALPFSKTKRFSYNLGILLNEYNSYSSTQGLNQLVVNYTTLYMGIENALSYRYFQSNNRRFFSEIRIGVDANKGLFAKSDYQGVSQRVITDVSSNPSFRGLIFMASVGMDFKYLVSPFTMISLGYNFRGSALNTGNESSEYLGFSSHQIKLGVHFIMRKKRDYEE